MGEDEKRIPNYEQVHEKKDRKSEKKSIAGLP